MAEQALRPVRRALLSVSEKQGMVGFARRLHAHGVALLSTGGTARLVRDEGLPVVDVADYTGFPEIMAGRVKTLHPRVHGGLLGRRGIDDAVMDEQGIEPIDLLAVNLYPFERAVARADCTYAEAIEHIDIGGPAMIRAAAKNHADVTVVTGPEDYRAVLDDLEAHGGVTAATRFRLAVRAFEHTARYEDAIANYLGGFEAAGGAEGFPATLNLQLVKHQPMRYGENPHQRAAFYREVAPAEPSVATARQLHGKALSYNNVADTDAALECVKYLTPPACVIVKHANPCGAAVGRDLGEAYERAFATDPTSAFGGIIAVNRTLDAATLRRILERQFVEVVCAPEVDDEAVAAAADRPNVRLLAVGEWPGPPAAGLDYQRVRGGLLVQERDVARLAPESLRRVSRRRPGDAELADLLFAWEVVRHVKSNAIVYAREGATVGIGAGQMSRVFSVRIGAQKAADAGLELAGAALASDAFFPFRDGVDEAARCGITAIIQPGGSQRDDEVIAAADEHGMAMVLTGTRHFRH